MIVQLSSGQGPAECELAVSLLYDALKEEYPDIKQLSHHSSKKKNCYTSIIFETESDLSELEGSILWICKSPFRPKHKRKNWYIDVSIIPEQKSICDDKNIRFQSFHCGGKGGQHVNKVETGIRLTHIPTGITVTSTSERSQYLNKKDALQKLNLLLAQKKQEQKDEQVRSAWREHTSIVRGNPNRVYEGIHFRRKTM